MSTLRATKVGQRTRATLAGLAGTALLLSSACSVRDDAGLSLTATPTSTAASVTPEALTAEAAEILEAHGLYAGGDWSAQKAELLEAGRTAADLDEARDAIAIAASSAGGVHTWYMSPSEREQAYASAPGSPPEVEATQGKTVTISLPPIGQEGDAAITYAEVGSSGLANLAGAATCGFIIDLRGNSGGNMYPMLGAVSPLFDTAEVANFVDRNGVTSAISVTKTQVSEGNNPPLTYAAPEPARGSARADTPIAILQDGETGSAAEMVITAFRGQENVRTFGMPTAGRATGNDAWVLSDGSELVLTIVNYADRSGAVMPLPIPADVPAISLDAEQSAHEWIGTACRT
ncbi:S41 family peptidase [Pseudoclavibacter helvolus]|uniref:S41 family peptidase n=1 Tax=Pseudoclavibacter helvolus TaxID=255205 RepID=UPI003C74B77E